jgi:hypothetical protein
MKKITFLIAVLSVFISCGPSPTELKKMQDDAQKTYDSIVKAAEKGLSKTLPDSSVAK